MSTTCKIFIVVCFTLLSLRAEIYEEVVVSRGVGTTQTTARRAALAGAIEQVNGVLIDANTGSKSLTRDEVEKINSEIASRAKVSDKVWQDIKTQTHGVVSRYRICSETEDSKGRWTSELQVVCSVFRPLDNSLRSIAIMPFRASNISYPLGRDSIPADQLVRRYNQKLVTAFTQSRRFRVLDRQYSQEFAEEQTRIKSAEFQKTDLVKIGRQIGADLLIVGDIVACEVSTRQLQLAEKSWDYNSAKIIIEFSVIDAATGQVRWSSNVTRTYNDNDLRRLELDGDLSLVQEQMLVDAAASISTEVLEIVSPVKILDVESADHIQLNQGGTRVSIGQCLAVFGPTKYLQDPENGSTIRVDGEEIAVLEVFNVQAKYSTARVAYGNVTTLQVGLTCRRGECPQKPSPDKTNAPPLAISGFQVVNGWQFQFRNASSAPLKVREIVKMINGRSEASSFSLLIGPGQTESFGMNSPFDRGDVLDVYCEGFADPQSYRFSP